MPVWIATASAEAVPLLMIAVCVHKATLAIKPTAIRIVTGYVMAQPLSTFVGCVLVVKQISRKHRAKTVMESAVVRHLYNVVIALVAKPVSHQPAALHPMVFRSALKLTPATHLIAVIASSNKEKAVMMATRCLAMAAQHYAKMKVVSIHLPVISTPTLGSTMRMPVSMWMHAMCVAATTVHA
jgi:hypothetical protein